METTNFQAEDNGSFRRSKNPLTVNNEVRPLGDKRAAVGLGKLEQDPVTAKKKHHEIIHLNLQMSVPICSWGFRESGMEGSLGEQ